MIFWARTIPLTVCSPKFFPNPTTYIHELVCRDYLYCKGPNLCELNDKQIQKLFQTAREDVQQAEQPPEIHQAIPGAVQNW